MTWLAIAGGSSRGVKRGVVDHRNTTGRQRLVGHQGHVGKRHAEAGEAPIAVSSPGQTGGQDSDAIFAALETVDPNQLRRNIGDLQSRLVHLAKQRGPVRVDPTDQRAVICARPFAERVRSPGALDG